MPQVRTDEYRRRQAEHKRIKRRENPAHFKALEKASRLRHLEASRQRSKEYHRKHRDRLGVYHRRWHKTNRDRCHAMKVYKLHGLAFGEYDAMLAAQNGVCAICQGPETQVDRRTGLPHRLAVDHDHISGKNRGLLCHACNIILGHVKDDPVKLRAAADYLERA